jgi:hypothetical protein
MSDLTSRQVLDLWNRYKPTIAVDAIEYDRELNELLGTNLAEVGTDCISRQAAIDTLENTKTAISENGERYIAKQNAIMRIDALPSAQPKRGKWSPADSLHHGAPFYFCSECGEKMLYTVMGNPRWNFCPNCGADMRGEKDE